jgi:hypothetical protein
MGNYNTRTVSFLQSSHDFPCPVTLGKHTPSFGLYRFNKALRFVPLDEEGFTMRGDKQRLVYKGRWRSHRFTILGDMAFEYDCILEREPESNVISLIMEGAENFDFFRQPDFVPDPFLKGSYAVYKKETLLGKGTGKLCHIHRPLIIDACGRKVWGDLSIVGNILRMTIPEQWLAEAKYPVIVDPTVGTTTVGSQNKWDNDPPEPWISLMFEGSIPVNRFLVNETINGNCTAYFYINEDDSDNGGRGVIYSDNGNKPHIRRSTQETFIDMRVNSSKPAGWRSGTFKSDDSIPGGSYIWFGCFADFFWFPRFDYGTKVYAGEWYVVGNSIPNNYPPFYDGWYKDFKLSMYFEYSSAQNYIRTLTQGVTLTDNRKLTVDYKRNTAEIVQANSTVNKLQTICRKLQETVHGWDNNSSSFLFFRSIQDTTTVSEIMHHLGAFFRGLVDNVKIESEAKPGRFYFLTLADTVQAVGIVFRGLLVFVHIVTGMFIRDYLLQRFLIAREEIVLKSPICREITLDSRIS